jgi:OOP family OmpA-OmpF porin
MNLKLFAGAALAGLVAASGAMAQDSGFYVGAHGGYHWPSSSRCQSDFNDTQGGYDHPFSWRLTSKDSWAAFGRIGYRFNPHVRAELEAGYRDSRLQSVTGAARHEPVQGLCNVNSAAPNCGRASGARTGTCSAMVNRIYDITPGSSISPFNSASAAASTPAR